MNTPKFLSIVNGGKGIRYVYIHESKLIGSIRREFDSFGFKWWYSEVWEGNGFKGLGKFGGDSGNLEALTAILNERHRMESRTGDIEEPQRFGDNNPG